MSVARGGRFISGDSVQTAFAFRNDFCLAPDHRRNNCVILLFFFSSFLLNEYRSISRSFPILFFLFNFYFISIFLFIYNFLKFSVVFSNGFPNFLDRFIFGRGKLGVGAKVGLLWSLTPLGFLPRLNKFPRRKRFTSNEWTRSHFHFFYLLLPSDTVTRRALIMRGVKRLSCDTSTLMYPAWKPRSESKDEDPSFQFLLFI